MAERPTPGKFVEYLDKRGMAHTALVLETLPNSLMLRVYRTSQPNLDIAAPDAQWRWKNGKAPVAEAIEYEFFETTTPRGEENERGPVEPPRSTGVGWTLYEKLERGPLIVFRWRRRVAKPKA